jgi:multiple sugar transport system permease protein
MSSARRQNLAAYVFVLPFFLFFVGLLVVPLVYSGYLSFFQERLVGGTVFVGPENFAKALADGAFLAGVGRMAVFLLIQVPIMLGLALVFALLLDSGVIRGQRAIRLIIFLPYAVPGVVAALMWGYLYGQDFGPISQLVQLFGLPPPDFFIAQNILAAMMNIVTWEFIGYNMIILYAVLQAVPTELYEAAAIDGAGGVRVAWSIKIPAIAPAIMLTVIFSIIGTFQLFNEPSLLNTLAPNAIDDAYTPNYYAYNLAFTDQNVNYAAAIAFVLGGVIAVVSYVAQTATRRTTRRQGLTE